MTNMNRKNILLIIIAATLLMILIIYKTVWMSQLNNNSQPAQVEDIYALYTQHPELRFKVDSDYTYSSSLIDLTPDAILNDKAAFISWQISTIKFIKDLYNAIPLESPKGLIWENDQQHQYGILKQYHCAWPDRHPLAGSKTGGTIAIPVTPLKDSPLVIFIHGHGMVPSREERTALFAAGSPAAELLAKGFTIWAPDNVYHEELKQLFSSYDYSMMWAKVANLTWPLLQHVTSKSRGSIVIGIAAGGLTGLVMSITNNDISGLITSGAFFPLELTRRDYRIKGHPICHDFRQFTSYVPIYACVLGRPLQIQMGRKDALWIGKPLVPGNNNFTGTKRGVFAEETLGGISLPKDISKKIKSRFSFVLHEGGHTDIDIQSALGFISAIPGY